MLYEIADISFLKPLERVFPYHLKNLAAMIMADGMVKCPIIADKATGIVLDGSHRYIFFLGEGFAEVPVRFVDYSDENIRVGTHLVHRYLCEDTYSCGISKKEVVDRGLSGNLFPPRTTRHFFPFRKPFTIDLPLDSLRSGEKVDISKYIENVTIEYEIRHNERFIQEIETEVDEVIVYLDEVRQTKNYLKKQVLEMSKSLRR
jgi:hypothetical protein